MPSLHGAIVRFVIQMTHPQDVSWTECSLRAYEGGLILKCGSAQYDKNRSQALEFEELRSVLADLGMLVCTTTCLHMAHA